MKVTQCMIAPLTAPRLRGAMGYGIMSEMTKARNQIVRKIAMTHPLPASDTKTRVRCVP